MGYQFRQARLTTPFAAEIVTPAEDDEIALLKRVHDVLEVRDGAAAGHVHRMAAVADVLARRLGLGASRALMIRAAASLHDIGKLMVSAGVLLKRGPLDRAERALIERHPLTGHQMLRDVDSPIFRLAATIALTHHERWDGDGYPLGLREAEIPLAGRIAAVADVFDALLSRRPYRPAMELGAAVATIEAGRGSHFDPDVVDALFSDLGETLAVR